MAFFDSCYLVNTGVSMNRMSPFSSRSKKLFDIGFEHSPVIAPSSTNGAGNAIMSQRGDERDGFPVPMWHLLHEPLALRRPAIEACDRGRDTVHR